MIIINPQDWKNYKKEKEKEEKWNLKSSIFALLIELISKITKNGCRNRRQSVGHRNSRQGGKQLIIEQCETLRYQIRFRIFSCSKRNISTKIRTSSKKFVLGGIMTDVESDWNWNNLEFGIQMNQIWWNSENWYWNWNMTRKIEIEI